MLFGLQILMVIALISGIVAFAGDWVGRYIGRKRLSVFGLRPRSTAAAITVLTGMIIAILTVLTLIAISEDVRIALFGLEELKSAVKQKERALQIVSKTFEEEMKIKTEQRKELSEKLEKIKKEYETTSKNLEQKISSLNKEKEKLNSEVVKLHRVANSLAARVEISKLGAVLFKINDPIITTIVEPGMTYDENSRIIKDAIKSADTALKQLGIFPEEARVIFLPEEELDEAVSYLKLHGGEIIVRVVAASNVIAGEKVPVHLELFENKLVFKSNELIASAKIDSGIPQTEIEQKIVELLSGVNKAAKEKGILPDPSGHVGNIPYSKISLIASQVKNKRKSATVSVYSVKDIYTLGPLDINIKIEK